MIKKEIAIKVHDLHKSFDLPEHRITSIKQAFVNIGHKNKKKRQVVLDGISFDVKKGDFFGIVGRNGSGKSTLLKILAGVYTPNAGAVEINGQLTPFIELGVGFNPELTGRDNVYLSSSLLGYNRKQVDKMYDDIVEFAELKEHMDKKLKNYSSGMQVRLAFSIAIKAKNDILIFDEVLAVGDEAFQRKCLDTFERYKAEKQTVILVTHDMSTVRRYCNRAIILDEGRILAEDDPQRIADHYSRLNQEQIDRDTNKTNQEQATDIRITTKDTQSKKPKSSFETGEDILLDIRWERNPKVDGVLVDIFKMSGEHITSFNSYKDGLRSIGAKTSISVSLKANLYPGKYFFNIKLRTKEDNDISVAYRIGQFSIIQNWERAGAVWAGLVPIDHRWEK